MFDLYDWHICIYPRLSWHIYYTNIFIDLLYIIVLFDNLKIYVKSIDLHLIAYFIK